MDIILFAILILFCLKGFFKGGISMIFSFMGVVFVAILSWWLCKISLSSVENIFGSRIFEWTKHIFDQSFVGSFSKEEIQSLLTAKLGIVGLFLTKILKNISFEGKLSAGQIFAPTVSSLILKVATFLCLFFLLFFGLKILQFFLNKIVKKTGLTFGNKILGIAVGLMKGLFVFGVLYFSISVIANILPSQNFLLFARSGQISNFLYDNLIIKLFNLFY